MPAQKYKGSLRERNKEAQKTYYETAKGKHTLWAYKLKRRYGMYPSDWQRMLQRQSYTCGACRKPFEKRRLSVDHCHKTGKVRGIIHQSCNAKLAWFENYNIGDYLAKLR